MVNILTNEQQLASRTSPILSMERSLSSYFSNNHMNKWYMVFLFDVSLVIMNNLFELLQRQMNSHNHFTQIVYLL
jgi:hypothetical protein